MSFETPNSPGLGSSGTADGEPHHRRSTSGSSGGPDGDPSGSEADWAANLAQRIQSLFDGLRLRTTDRLVGLAKGVVFGLASLILAAAAGLLALIGLLRAMDLILPSGVWLAYVVLGSLFVAAGSVLWSKRGPINSSAGGSQSGGQLGGPAR
ncbi:MAG: hypothetical protein ACT4OS_10350 [Acidimicrobiales bacterium]